MESRYSCDGNITVGGGQTFEELEEAINSYPDERMLPYLTPDSTFKITVESFGKVISFQEQNNRLQKLAFIPFKIMMIDDYGSENGLPSIVRRRIIFGWEIGTTNRKILQTYQLHSQKYLGPTAMDAEMVLLMANQAQVRTGKLVLTLSLALEAFSLQQLILE